jgi:hypothetical protein
MRTLLFFLAALPVAVAAACSATPSTPTTSSGVGGQGGTATASTGSGQGASASTGANVGGHFGTGGGASSIGCSADLQAIVDDLGNKIQDCPPDQGCAAGVCVPACAAAAASNGGIGCDFFAAEPAFYGNGTVSTFNGACYAMFLANTWSRPAQITVTRGGQSFSLAQFGRIPSGILPNITYDPIPATGLPPDQVAVLFLSHDPNAKHPQGGPMTCPVTPALAMDAAIQGGGMGTAFHVVVDTPVTAYDILPYGGAKSYLPSASLLYPATAWGTNYYVVAPHADSNGMGKLWMMLVGAFDGTKVTLGPAMTLLGGGGLPNAPSGVGTVITLDAGQTAQYIGIDPTSAVLESSQPIGVFAGGTYMLVASATSPGGGGLEAAHQQLAHIKALGSEYVGGGVVSRLKSLAAESVPYRLIGVVDGTMLTWDPGAPGGVPTMLKAGQVAEFETTSLFSVKSQDEMHPFGMTQYMSGNPGPTNSRDGCGPVPPFPFLTACQLGDEEWVSLVAPKQFLQRYVFFTDPTYATTNLVITRVKGANGFADVTVDCLGSPVTGWQPVGTSGKYEVAHVDLVRGTVPVAQCTGSRQQATSKGQFGVVVWGTDWFASYGYPAGGNIGEINPVTVPAVPK